MPRLVWGQTVTRIVWFTYLAVLTWLLVDRDPLKVVHAQPQLFSLIQHLLPLVHAAAFGMLALLTIAARWPLPHALSVSLLVVYGFVTEWVQALIPARTADPADMLQNVSGITVGCVVGWAVGRLWTGVASGRLADLAQETGPTDAWDVLIRVQQLPRQRSTAKPARLRPPADPVPVETGLDDHEPIHAPRAGH